MDVFMMYFLFALGLVLIIKGGDFFVDAAAWLAEVSGIPHFIVGATVVGFATSLPEVIVSVIAATQGEVEIANGNAIGSVTANTGLILGVSLLFMPMAIRLKDYLPKILILIGTIAIVWLFGMFGGISIIPSVILVAIFAFFIYENVRSAKRELAAHPEPTETAAAVTPKVIAIKIALFVLGCAGIIIGSELLVNNGSAIAASLGVDPRIISISAVAVGTSLPEFVTTISAITKKEASLSVGNIIGSNIIDLTFILPPCVVASGKTINFSSGTLFVDIPALAILTLAAFVPTFITKKFARWQGVALLAIYIAYLAYSFAT